MIVEPQKSEDLLVLFACHPSTSNVKKIVKALESMFEMKKQNDSTDRFNFIAFQQNGPVYFEDFLFDYSYITDTLMDIKDTLVPANIAGGIMIAVTFIIDVFKIVGDKVYRLLIVTDQSARPLRNTEVLNNLVGKVLDLPFYVDIVRFNTDIPSEDLKFIKFAKKNNGNVSYAEGYKNLRELLVSLGHKKEVPKNVLNEKSYHISEENLPFFENLAQGLWVVDSAEKINAICQICRQSEGELVKCPKCDSISHADCLAQWAKMSNIGAPNLFRCMNCFNLLKLPRDFIEDVQSGKYQRSIEVHKSDQTKILLEKEKESSPQLQQGQDPLGGMPESYQDEEYSFKDDADLQIQFCENCGTLNLPEALRCSNCGKQL